MNRSWRPAFRRCPLQKRLARGPVRPRGKGVRRRLLSICLLLLCNDAVAQEWPGSAAKLSPDQEPLAPIPAPVEADPRKLALGERLFRDPRLSGNGTLACSSCHDLATNGAGRSTPAREGVRPSFDTLTVFNASLSFRLNWEGSYRSLGEQAEASLESPAIMGTSVEEVLAKLSADAEMVQQFRAAYGSAPDRINFFDALATFEGSLLTPGSRFDRWLGGDKSALSAGELEGYQLFKSLGCSSCHQGANVGGNLFERQRIFGSLVGTETSNVRVPSLRNVAVTAPYFHDGSTPTLAEAVRKMGATQLGWSISERQIDAIVAFLQTLTGTFRGKPVVRALR